MSGSGVRESLLGSSNDHHGREEKPSLICAPSVDADDDTLKGGLSIPMTAAFIVAEIAGSGILALPNALAGTRWTGIGLIIVLGLLAIYCGVMLGKCWNIVRERPDVPKKIRDPYPLLGYHAFGRAGKYVVEVCILLTLIGSSVVYLILSAKQISSILNVSIGSFDNPDSEFRIWIVICGVVLIPCTWFATPKEFWLIAYGATLCSIASCFLIIVRSSMLIYNEGLADSTEFLPPTLEGFFTSFGTIAFAYGGGVMLPTLQADMKKPSKFIFAAVLGFTGIFLLYVPCAILPYVGIGSKIDPNILVTLKNLPGTGKEIVTISETLMTFHLLLAIIILSNPTSLLLEEKFGIPHRFGWKRVLIRSLAGLLVIGIAELFPSFGPILSFIGASTVTMMSFLLPAIFYLRLQDPCRVPLYQKVFHVEIILIAFVLGCAGIYSSILGFKNPFKTYLN